MEIGNCCLVNLFNKGIIMEQIIESILVGQRIQALEQLISSQYLLEDLFEELLELGIPKEIITMYRVAVNQGYLTFKE